MTIASKLLKGAAATGAAALAYARLARPVVLHWGTRPAERSGPIAGDAVVPHPTDQSTHAITIDAPPEDVWPWLAQLGWDKGGFYSYTALENLAGASLRRAGILPEGLRMKNVDTVVPEWQDIHEGDQVKFSPDPATVMDVAEADPAHALVLKSTGGPPPTEMPRVVEDIMMPARTNTWSFELRPEGGGTRLLARTRGETKPTLAARLSNLLLWEPAHFIMERKMLLGIKERAEREARIREARAVARGA